MSYSAKISRTGGSLKNLFVTGKPEQQIRADYFCTEDLEFDHSELINESHAELESAEDILSAWLDGLNKEEEQE